jgi:hypothetical protein
MASAAFMVGALVSTGGLTALVVEIFNPKKNAKP